MSFYKDYYNRIKIRQEQLKNSIPTIIPFRSFPRLSSYVAGIIPGDRIIVTAGTGVGKSRFCRKVFMKDIVDFAKENNLSVKILLNSLEESKDKVVSSVLASAINKKYGVDYSYYELNNYSTKPMSAEMHSRISSCEEDVDDFERYVDIVHEANPYGFYKYVLRFLYNNGTFLYNDVPVLDFEQVCRSSSSWNTYIPNNPRQLVIAISDTIDAYQEEKELNLYQTVKRFSKFFLTQQLCLTCNVIGVMVQQQLPDKETWETNIKGNTIIEKMKPSLDALQTCRATANDATLVIGLFNPLKFDAFDYLGYPDLRNLKDGGQFRSLLILKTREGYVPPGSELPLYTQLGRDEFYEMPKLQDKEKLINYYEQKKV